MKSLLEIQKNAGDSMEFIENVKIDLFPDEVYVFTPKGRILTLPMGATPVDFAYAVHTDVGNTCVAARIDNRLAPLSLPLHTGQTVEIVTVPGTRPNPAWLNFAITSKARSSIRHFLKDQQQSEAVDLGRRLLEKTLSTQGSGLAKLPPEQIAVVLQEFGLPDLDALCEDIGIGNRVPQIVAARLLPDGNTDDTTRTTAGSTATRGIAIRGTEGLVVTYARCCRPLPGDTIVGHLSAGRGIVIHRDTCNNVLAELRDNPDKCMTLRWAEKVEREFPSELRIELDNQRGMLAEIARQITDHGANIEGITLQEKGSRHAVMQIALQVRDRIQLARIIKRIRIISGVQKITRVKA